MNDASDKYRLPRHPNGEAPSGSARSAEADVEQALRRIVGRVVRSGQARRPFERQVLRAAGEWLPRFRALPPAEQERLIGPLIRRISAAVGSGVPTRGRAAEATFRPDDTCVAGRE